MSHTALALRVLLVCLFFVIACWALLAAVRSARRGGKGVQAIGAALMMFGWGNMRDPGNDTVAEAKDGRVRRGNEAGDVID